ncbi:hypothetical protein BH24ACI4_BH24ACI4_25300 [soil metagenome]
MRRCAFVCSALLCVLSAAGLAAFEPVPRAQGGCSDFTLPQTRFQVLNNGQGSWKNAYVYVGEIRPRMFGGFEPFTLHVVLGKWYPPLNGAAGPLAEATFLKVTGTPNVQPFKTQVSKGGEVLSFTVEPKASTLTVTRVGTTKGDEKVELRLCP